MFDIKHRYKRASTTISPLQFGSIFRLLNEVLNISVKSTSLIVSFIDHLTVTKLLVLQYESLLKAMSI